RHRMFADHCCAERCQLAKAAGNEVAEWTAIPGRDNHLFDCVVGCFAGAAVQGLRKPGERPTRRREKEDE
ncbi:MAG: phage terminase large subunit family protein, partial [Thermoguttaceae bacterium]|nr:phage terminase large subunit family protein [Thermoguttaceae bacterium]